jgi:hypothetical protein
MKNNRIISCGIVVSTAILLSTIGHAQNVGIGVSNPQSKLSINGTSSSGGLAIGDSTYTSTAGTVAPVGGAIVQGNVGIGTTSLVAGANVDVFNPVSCLMLLEAGGASAGVAELQLRNDSTTSREVLIEMTDPTTTKGFQLGLDAGGIGTNTFSILDRVRNSTCLFIDPAGNTGIGISTPLAPLHVATSANFNETNVTQTYFTFNSALLVNNVGVTALNVASAIFANAIWSGGAVVSYTGPLTASDARLKNVIGHSDSAKDLETLEKIEITDYTMKDVVKEGNAPSKKVIAQQVEKVYPTAVKTIGYKGFTFTPDIYAVSSSVKAEGQNAYTISLAKAHSLKEGETIRLITEKNPELSVVAHVVDDKTFTVTTKEVLGDKVFVYGKQCLDLKSVDYDAIAMLNVSATQELAKKVTALEAEVADLKAVNDKLTIMRSEMETLKNALAGIQAKDAAASAIALNR